MLAVILIDVSTPATTFSIAVPGDQTWRLRSVRATANIDTGGAPDRSYQLTVTDGTTPVVTAGADDTGDEPGTCTITWTDVPAAFVSSGPVGVVVAPLPNLRLNSGYVITGTIVNPAGADAWADAVVWFDFAYTEPR